MLLGEEYRKGGSRLCFLGGKVELMDEDAAFTAVREFFEVCRQVLVWHTAWRLTDLSVTCTLQESGGILGDDDIVPGLAATVRQGLKSSRDPDLVRPVEFTEFPFAHAQRSSPGRRCA